jgi:adenylate cyclase
LALASICFFTGRFGEAAIYSTKALQSSPGFSVMHAYLVASQINLGAVDAARAAAQRLLEIAPAFTIGAFARMDFVRPALRKAGLPE